MSTKGTSPWWWQQETTTWLCRQAGRPQQLQVNYSRCLRLKRRGHELRIGMKFKSCHLFCSCRDYLNRRSNYLLCLSNTSLLSYTSLIAFMCIYPLYGGIERMAIHFSYAMPLTLWHCLTQLLNSFCVPLELSLRRPVNAPLSPVQVYSSLDVIQRSAVIALLPLRWTFLDDLHGKICGRRFSAIKLCVFNRINKCVYLFYLSLLMLCLPIQPS